MRTPSMSTWFFFGQHLEDLAGGALVVAGDHFDVVAFFNVEFSGGS